MGFDFMKVISFVAVAALPHVVLAQTHESGSKNKPSLSLPVDLSYTADSCVYVAHSGGKTPECWSSTKGISDVTISPDGSALALTFNSPKAGSMRSNRRIAIIDSKGEKPRVLDSIPGDNSYGPVWSPDSKQLMFSHLNAGQLNVAVVNRDGSGFHVLPSSVPAPSELHCAFWAHDGKSLYAYNWSALYQIGLDGKEISRLPFSDLSLTLTTLGGRVALSPDGIKLLVEIKDGESPGGVTIIYVCDTKTKKKSRITSRHGEISGPSWLPNGNAIVYTSTSKVGGGIYQKELSTGIEALLVSGASAPSVSGVHP